jgi:hypothetical protein
MKHRFSAYTKPAAAHHDEQGLYDAHLPFRDLIQIYQPVDEDAFG